MHRRNYSLNQNTLHAISAEEGATAPSVPPLSLSPFHLVSNPPRGHKKAQSAVPYIPAGDFKPSFVLHKYQPEEHTIREIIKENLARKNRTIPDLKKGMEAVLLLHSAKQRELETRRWVLKQELLKLFQKTEETAPKSPGNCIVDTSELFSHGDNGSVSYFTSESETQPEAYANNAATIERILSEICMPEDCYEVERNELLEDIRKAQPALFTVALKVTDSGDGLAVYFYNGVKYQKLTGDCDLPQYIEPALVETKYVYEESSCSLREDSAESFPDAMLLK